MSDIDGEIAKALAADLIGPGGAGGIRKLCTDARRCGMGLACEHAQHRDESVELLSCWTAPQKTGECENYFPRTELGSSGDIPRKQAGQPRHNRHAPDRERERAKLLGPDGKPIQPPKDKG